MTLILTILAFALMIFIHELGHFWMARRFGVGIEKFSIGFGKPLISFTHKDVLWQIGWIPLGGFVKMRGDNPSDLVDAPEDSFVKKPWYQKALIAFAGPFANLLLGILLFVISFMLPIRVHDHHPVIFEAAGKWADVFAPQDSIVAVNSKNITGWYEALGELSLKKENTISLIRADSLIQIQIKATEVDSLLHSLSPVLSTQIGEVYAGMPAWRAGVRDKDIIMAVDSTAVYDWYTMRKLIVGSPRNKVLLTLMRDGKMLMREVVLETNVAMGSERLIGITNSQPVTFVRSFGFGQALTLGSLSSLDFIVRNYGALFKVFSRPEQLTRNIGGPVMIATMSSQVSEKGLSYLILFFGGISLVLVIMNLLPIPILDGGHILFAIIEGIIRRPVPVAVQEFLQRVGFMLLLLLMIIAFYSDISKVLMRLAH